MIGKISEINRYPIKSFAGERIEGCQIETYGVYGDRGYAFIDETKEGWSRFITARAIPKMLAYKARLTGICRDNEFPEVTVTSPDGRTMGWDEALLAEIQDYSKKKGVDDDVSTAKCRAAGCGYRQHFDYHRYHLAQAGGDVGQAVG